MEAEKIETSPSNGAAPPSSVKPWITAGFKSRDAWRASKGHKTAKPKVKAAVKAAAPSKPKAKKAKKPVKKSVKLAPKVKPKVKTKKSVRKEPSVIDGSLKPVPLAELSPRMKKVFLAVPKGGTKTIEYIQDAAFPNMSHAQGNSTTRNQLRFLRVHKMFKKLGDGKYKRIA